MYTLPRLTSTNFYSVTPCNLTESLAMLKVGRWDKGNAITSDRLHMRTRSLGVSLPHIVSCSAFISDSSYFVTTKCRLGSLPDLMWALWRSWRVTPYVHKWPVLGDTVTHGALLRPNDEDTHCTCFYMCVRANAPVIFTMQISDSRFIPVLILFCMRSATSFF